MQISSSAIARRIWAACGVILTMGLLALGLASPASATVSADSPTPWATGDPSYTPLTNKPTKIGVNYHGMWTENTATVRGQILDKYAAAGVKWVRMDVSWASLQPSNSTSYDMAGGVAMIDTRLNEIAAHGMKADVMLYWPPQWSSGVTTKDGEPTNFADFGNVLGWAANRWKVQAPVWEMWNEPDLPNFWKSQDATKFANMIKVAYPIAKAASPTTTFLLGSPTYLGLASNWFSKVYTAGIKGNYDAISVHPYMSASDLAPTGNATGSARKWSIVGISDLKTLMNQYGDASTPIYATEFGWSTHTNVGTEANYKRGITEAQQGDYTLGAYGELANQGVSGAFVYTDRDMINSDVQEANFGLLHRDLSPKAGYFGLKCAASNICSASSNPPPVPSVPTGLATSLPSASGVTLAWTAVSGASGYDVYRNGVKVSSRTTTGYVDSGLSANTTYSYTVTATNGGGSSATSAAVSFTTRPEPVTGLTAAASGANAINVAWNAVPGATGYLVYRDDVLVSSPTATSYRDTGLTPSTQYGYVLKAANGGNYSSASATVNAATTVAIASAPTGLTATANGQNAIALNWAASAGATSYTVLRATGSGTPVTVIASSTDGTFSDTGLSAGTTYTYAVVANNAGGASGASASASATTVVDPPAKPSGLTATGTSQTRIELTWDSTPGATSYVIYRAAGTTAPTAALATTSDTRFSDPNLSASSTFTYSVKAVNDGGSSLMSNFATATTIVDAPGTPAGFGALPDGQNGAILNWNSTGGATSYDVYRDTEKITTVTDSNFTDTGLTAATSYSYKIVASNAGGSSPATAVESITTLPNPPGKPTGLTATGTSQTRIEVTWDATPGATSYMLYRAPGTATPTAALATPITSTYANLGLPSGTAYTYSVKALNAGGYSAMSDSATAATIVDPPTTPTGFVVAANGQTEAQLNWDSTSGATGYDIYRDDTKLTTVTDSTYTDTGLTAATSHSYSIIAVNPGGSSPATATATITTLPNAPAQPTGLSATAASQTRIELEWNASPGATSYVVYRAAGSATPSTPLATTTAPSYSDASLSDSSTFTYSVKAINTGGNSPMSEVATETTLINPPNSPTGLNGSAPSASAANLSWAATATATGYDVYRDNNKVGSATGPTYADSGLSPNTSYSFAVVATNAGGGSAKSSPINVMTRPEIVIGVTAAAQGANRVSVNWAATDGATGYLVFRNDVLVSRPTSTTFLDTGLTASTQYAYVLKATNGVTNSSASAAVIATTTVNAPVGPTSLTAIANGQNAVDLSWPAVSGATSYEVYRADDSGSPTTAIGTSSTTTYSDSGLTAGSTHTYAVAAVNAGGKSGASPTASATTSIPAPAKPTGLTNNVVSQTRIDLSWNTTSGATSYTVFRGTGTATPAVSIATTTDPNYSNTGLTANSTYTFTVKAVNLGGTSPMSDNASATTLIDPPAAPSGFHATASGQNAAALSWNAASTATSYTVLRTSGSGNPSTTVGSATGTSFADSGLTAGTTYTYAVKATNAGGASASSTTDSITTAPLVPVAPTGVKATSTGATAITITWSDVTGAASYTVYRGPGTTTPTTAIATPAAATYTNTGLSASTEYNYAVKATNVSGTSPLSSSDSATTTVAAPGAPTGLTATATGSSAISLSWTATSAATSYTILRSTGSATPTTDIQTQSGTTYADTGLSGSTTYTYAVKATNVGGTGAASAPKSATTALDLTAGVGTLFGTSTPATLSEPDTRAIELGVTFSPKINGQINGIRFYKGAASNGGAHLGTLWTATGTKLGSVTFSTETSSGWQRANFATPINITVGTSYVVSYFAPQGKYSNTINALTNQQTMTNFTVPANAGRYVYSTTSKFPTKAALQNKNYFVDLVFTPAS